MKILEKPDGSREVDGTPEELAEYVRRTTASLLQPIVVIVPPVQMTPPVIDVTPKIDWWSPQLPWSNSSWLPH